MIKRINTAGSYQIELAEKEIEILITGEISIILPKWVPETYTLKIKCLFAGCNVTVFHGQAPINGYPSIVLTDGILIVDYKSKEGFFATNLIGGSGGTGFKTKKITGIDCGTWAAGVEIEPTKAGVIFMPMTAFLIAEDHLDSVYAYINSSTGIGNAFTATSAPPMSPGDNVNFALMFNGINEFKNDLYLYGDDLVNPGNVTLYVTYQEITL